MTNIKLIDVSFNYEPVFFCLDDILRSAHGASFGFLNFIKEHLNVTLVYHIGCEEKLEKDGVRYIFFKNKTSFKHIPFKTLRYIKNETPDVVLVEGLVFPIHIITIRFLLGKKVKIVVQHHGEKPFAPGIKMSLQKLANKYIDAYIFTSLGNAEPWLKNGIINTMDKCHEVLEASTHFVRQDKQESRNRLGLPNNDILKMANDLFR